MNFEETLDQTGAMLQRRGRVTYRTLKRQFGLDDEALDDLTPVYDWFTEGFDTADRKVWTSALRIAASLRCTGSAAIDGSFLTDDG